MGILGDWASFELTFKVVDENNPEAKSADIWSNYGIEGAQGWRNLGGQAVVYHAPVPASDVNAAHKAVNFSSLKDLKSWDHKKSGGFESHHRHHVLLVFLNGVSGSNAVLTENRLFELLQNHESRKVPCNNYGKRCFSHHS
jgi:hypothetical protein